MNADMKVGLWDIAKVKPYDKNPRRNDGPAVDVVARSIQQFGFRQPIVVDGEGVIIAGHTRWKAAKKLKLKQVPVHVATDMTPEQVKAYRIADNSTNQVAGWDNDLLRGELLSLSDFGFDFTHFGFSDVDLSRLGVVNAGESDPDEVIEPPADPVSRLGDVWICGKHRVMCGDSTKAEDVAAVLAGRKPFVCVTDPPYGVEYDSDWRNHIDSNKGLMNARNRTGKVEQDHEDDWREAYKLFPGDVMYVWHAGGGVHSAVVADGLVEAGFQIRSQIIWRKNAYAMSRGHYHWGHEPLWYSVRKGAVAKWCGDRTQTTIWDISSLNPTGHGKAEQDATTEHSTQKPLECMARPIRNHGGPEDDVYDPFLGSGTTVIAAEMSGRRCVGLELSPNYVDVIVQRWQKFTGEVATLEATGQTLQELAADRKRPKRGRNKKASAAVATEA